MNQTIEVPNRINVHVRWMIRRDMPEVLEIEALSFEHSWGEDDFLRALRQRNIIGMVAERKESVLGFMIYSLEKYSLDIMNLAVHPSCRRLDIGTQMIQKMIGKLAENRRGRIKTMVRETNTQAHLFLKAMGFTADSVERGFYGDTDEDAYLMQYRLRVS